MKKYKWISDIIIKKCLKIKKNERVIVITDKFKKKIAENIFESAKIVSDSILLEIPPTKFNGEDPSSFVYEIIEKADVIIAPTTMSLSHTRAFTNARNHGARIASLPGITEKIFLNTINLDYHKMSRLTKKLADYCKCKKDVKVMNKIGTNVEFSIEGRKPMVLDGLCHSKGGFINLPDGEMCIAPIEDSMNGSIIFDLSMSPDHKTKFGKIGLLKNEIIDLKIKNGKIIHYGKGKKSEILKKIIENADENANSIAEFAFGTNEKARITGYILEDEKALGTIHFAFGSNVSLGGITQSNLHLDGLISKPNVFIDNVQIMKDGKILL